MGLVTTFLLVNTLTGQPAGNGIADSTFPTLIECVNVKRNYLEAAHGTNNRYDCKASTTTTNDTVKMRHGPLPAPIVDTPIHGDPVKP